ncbi:hypothetical protein [uncultured Ruminobacter sp.]|uniref:hypothetical protein n=1 Tax=uncultured Ruminobacter sp. TaxID=538947 RepID=UPI0025CD6F3F|nr:hypothetical protein [uncultured Ruminobacter sp.]
MYNKDMGKYNTDSGSARKKSGGYDSKYSSRGDYNKRSSGDSEYETRAKSRKADAGAESSLFGNMNASADAAKTESGSQEEKRRSYQEADDSFSDLNGEKDNGYGSDGNTDFTSSSSSTSSSSTSSSTFTSTFSSTSSSSTSASSSSSFSSTSSVNADGGVNNPQTTVVTSVNISDSFENGDGIYGRTQNGESFCYAGPGTAGSMKAFNAAAEARNCSGLMVVALVLHIVGMFIMFLSLFALICTFIAVTKVKKFFSAVNCTEGLQMAKKVWNLVLGLFCGGFGLVFFLFVCVGVSSDNSEGGPLVMLTVFVIVALMFGWVIGSVYLLYMWIKIKEQLKRYM